MTVDVPCNIITPFFSHFLSWPSTFYRFPPHLSLGHLWTSAFSFRNPPKDPPPILPSPTSLPARLQNDGCEGKPNSSVLVLPLHPSRGPLLLPVSEALGGGAGKFGGATKTILAERRRPDSFQRAPGPHAAQRFAAGKLGTVFRGCSQSSTTCQQIRGNIDNRNPRGALEGAGIEIDLPQNMCALVQRQPRHRDHSHKRTCAPRHGPVQSTSEVDVSR